MPPVWLLWMCAELKLSVKNTQQLKRYHHRCAWSKVFIWNWWHATECEVLKQYMYWSFLKPHVHIYTRLAFIGSCHYFKLFTMLAAVGFSIAHLSTWWWWSCCACGLRYMWRAEMQNVLFAKKIDAEIFLPFESSKSFCNAAHVYVFMFLSGLHRSVKVWGNILWPRDSGRVEVTLPICWWHWCVGGRTSGRQGPQILLSWSNFC